MRSHQVWKYIKNNNSGVSLTASVDHDESSVDAAIHRDKIIATVTQATAGKAATATLNTPVPFKIRDVLVSSASADANSGKVVTVKNSGTNIATVTAATAESTRPTSIDQSEIEFSEDDDDLKIVLSGSSAGSAIVVLDIEFT